MKDFDKSSIFTGVLLLAIASIFSISLVLQPLDFGILGPGHNNVFFKLGHLLYSVYGFSSIFIPLFLLLSGLSCFASKWSARKTMRLVTALVPFFTCVITENLCRSIIDMGSSEFLGIKVAVVAITGIMLIVIEFIGSGIIADNIMLKKGKGTFKDFDSESDLEDEFKDDFEFPEDDFIEKEDSEQKFDDISESEVENSLESDNFVENDTIHHSSPSIFDNAIPTKVFPLTSDSSEKTQKLDDDSISNDFDNVIENKKEEKIKDSVEHIIKENNPIKVPAVEDLEEKIREETKLENNDVESAADTNSIITQEEFAALTDPIVPVDELEWPNLMPEVKELPPDYDEDFDENDPALEFPPKDEEETLPLVEKADLKVSEPEVGLVDDLEGESDEVSEPDVGFVDDLEGESDEGSEPDVGFVADLEGEPDEVSEPEVGLAADLEGEPDEVSEPEVGLAADLEGEPEEGSEPEVGLVDDLEGESDEVSEPEVRLAADLEGELEEGSEPEVGLAADLEGEPEEGSEPEVGLVDDLEGEPDDDGELEIESDFNNKTDNSLEESENFDDIELEDDISDDFTNQYNLELSEDENDNVEENNIDDIELPSIDDDFDSAFIEDPDDELSPTGFDSDSDENLSEDEEAEKEFGLDDINLDFGDVFKLGDNKEEPEEVIEEDQSAEEIENEESNDDINLDFGDFGLGLMDDEKPKKTENHNFPNRIVIHDGSEIKETDEENPKPKIIEKKTPINTNYSNRINLQDSFDDDEDGQITFVSERNDAEEDSDDDYEDDITLPMPDFEPEFDIEETADSVENDDESTEDIKNPESDSLDDIILDDEGFTNIENNNGSVHFNGSDVFSEMEEDIRKNQEEKLAVQNEDILPPTINRATKRGPYIIPSDLLVAYKDDKYWIIDDDTKQDAANLKQTLSEFNIEADVIGIKKGPVVTMFELLPAPGVRLSKIVALQDNIALSLAAQSVRIVAPIPGKQAVGIEVPNKKRSVVGFRELIETSTPEWDKMAVPVVLGKDILGKSQIIDLVKTPHMLIAGATGSGKSVCVNSLILSILFKRSYKDVKLILVDPKVVELKLYNDIPHLLTPVITEPKKALKALQYCLCEMERRYALLDGMGVRDISNYNQKIKEQNICTEKLPYIVVIIDEFADLMATSGKELESIVARLTAMSRAVGIHLVLATQRPSVNVITGLIKANIPTRIAFMVASRTDSNIIIDSVGAEKLLGRGDMLYASAVDPAPIRIQGTFVSDQEVEDVVKAVKEYGEPDYLDDSIFDEDEEAKGTDLFGEPVSDDDPLYDQALEIVVQAGKASASYIQRKLKIGYNRAARLVEEMEDRGIVGPANGSKPREIIHMP